MVPGSPTSLSVSVCCTLFLMFVTCCLNVIDVSYVTPRIVGVWVCVRGVLFMVRLGMCLCSDVQFVSSVHVDLAGASVSLFVVHQSCRVSR